MGTIHCLDNEGTWYILIYTHLTKSPLKLLTGNSGSLYRGWGVGMLTQNVPV